MQLYALTYMHLHADSVLVSTIIKYGFLHNKYCSQGLMWLSQYDRNTGLMRVWMYNDSNVLNSYY